MSELILSSNTLNAGRIAINNWYSGNTYISNLSAGTNTSLTGTITSPTINMSADINLTTISASTIYSGSTDLSLIFQTIAQDNVTHIQPGLNTYTGGTALLPTVNLYPNILLTTLTANTISATTISATTLYSGSTDLSLLFQTIAQDNVTHIQQGLNTYTGGTPLSPTVNVSGLTINNINVSGSSTFNTFSAQTISATTLYSGSTDLSSLLASKLFIAGTGTGSIVANNGAGNTDGGNYTLVAGSGNTANALVSSVLGGSNNTIQTQSDNSSICAGLNNNLSGVSSFIGSGNGNIIYRGSINFIGGGELNIISGNTGNTIICGSGNVISGSNSRGNAIVGGDLHTISGLANGGGNFIGGGSGHSITNSTASLSSLNSIFGGVSNKIDGAITASTINFGAFNLCLSSYSSVGGLENSADTNSKASVILGGQKNYANSNFGFIGGGYSNLTTGEYSCVPAGRGNEAAHQGSIACGSGSKTRQNFDIVVGCDASTSGVTDISDVANNTIRLQGISGDIYATGTLHSGGADYCELFEWDVIEKSDKLGLFVSLVNGDKIEVGNKNIIGVISNKPTVLGNSSPNQWINMYEKNEWGEKVTKIYNIYNIEGINVYVDSEGTKYSEYPNPKFPSGILFDGDISNGKIISTIEIAVINPSYNANIEYTDRSIRPEWGKVGLLGRLLVKTSEEITSKFADADSNGYAINGTKYPVLKIVREYKDGDYGIVQILFR